MVSTSSRMSSVFRALLGSWSEVPTAIAVSPLRCRLQTEALPKALCWAGDLGKPKAQGGDELDARLVSAATSTSSSYSSKPIPPT